MIHFLVHSATDTVGVAVTESVKCGQALTGRVMDTGEMISIVALDDIPLGHKIAVADTEEKGTVMKYGHDIGRAVAPIKKGQHVHVHNLRTKRW